MNALANYGKRIPSDLVLLAWAMLREVNIR